MTGSRSLTKLRASTACYHHSVRVILWMYFFRRKRNLLNCSFFTLCSFQIKWRELRKEIGIQTGQLQAKEFLAHGLWHIYPLTESLFDRECFWTCWWNFQYPRQKYTSLRLLPTRHYVEWDIKAAFIREMRHDINIQRDINRRVHISH
jgi:hypothetical protein